MTSTFYVGQLVRLEKPLCPGNSRSYCITRILASEGGIPTYHIKNVNGAEWIVDRQDIKAASANAVP
jgi:hypothetical protein